MARRSKEGNMELSQLRNDLDKLSTLVVEMKTILGGSASLDYKGMRADVRDLKNDVHTLKTDLEKMKREQEEEKKKSGLFSIKLSTVPQKIVAAIAFIALLLTVMQSLKELINNAAA